MITRRTTLILGAGASQPYGFPTGRKLLVEICDNLLARRESELKTALKNCGFRPDELNEFRRRLRRSQQPSVDAFLEEEPEFERLGKAAIVLSLIPREKEGTLYRGKKQQWYEYLFGQMRATREQFSENKLSIVTFNYDRSLEYSLFMAIQNTYGIPAVPTAEMLRAIEIIHVYGQLGALPYLGGSAPRGYEPDLDYTFVMEQCIDEIHIMRRGEDLTPRFRRAQQLARNATDVHFLGFAYHRMNVERLGVMEWPQSLVWGSAYNLMHMERLRAQKLFPKGTLRLGEGNWKTLEYMRTCVQFEDL